MASSPDKIWAFLRIFKLGGFFMDLSDLKSFITDHKKYFGLLLLILILFFVFGQKERAANKQDSLIQHESIADSKNQTSARVKSIVSQKMPATVTIDIVGAVKEQGVYTLKNGARIQQAIEAAGGLRKNAQLKAVNRAVVLKDQDKIYIPYRGEKGISTAATTGSANPAASAQTENGGEAEQKINLNTASSDQLQKLNGIGEKKAAQIINYREKQGPFKKISDLMQVSGIGEKTFAALKDQLAI